MKHSTACFLVNYDIKRNKKKFCAVESMFGLAELGFGLAKFGNYLLSMSGITWKVCGGGWEWI